VCRRYFLQLSVLDELSVGWTDPHLHVESKRCVLLQNESCAPQIAKTKGLTSIVYVPGFSSMEYVPSSRVFVVYSRASFPKVSDAFEILASVMSSTTPSTFAAASASDRRATEQETKARYSKLGV